MECSNVFADLGIIKLRWIVHENEKVCLTFRSLVCSFRRPSALGCGYFMRHNQEIWANGGQDQATALRHEEAPIL